MLGWHHRLDGHEFEQASRADDRQGSLARRRLRRARTLSAAESYPTSEVRDSGPECQAVTAQEGPGGATPLPRSGAAGRSHLAPEARGGDPEEPPQPRGQGWQLGGATHARSQGEAMAEQAQEGLEELSNIEGQQRWQ